MFDTGHFTDDTDREFVFTLPNTAASSNVTSAVTFRMCGYAGQYAGHRTSLRACKLSADPSLVQTAFNLWKFDHGFPATAAADSDSDNDGIPLLLEYALNFDPTTASTTGLPAGAISNNSLTLTYTKVKAATDITYAAEVAGAVTGLWTPSFSAVDQSWVKEHLIPLALNPIKIDKMAQAAASVGQRGGDELVVDLICAAGATGRH